MATRWAVGTSGCARREGHSFVGTFVDGRPGFRLVGLTVVVELAASLVPGRASSTTASSGITLRSNQATLDCRRRRRGPKALQERGRVVESIARSAPPGAAVPLPPRGIRGRVLAQLSVGPLIWERRCTSARQATLPWDAAWGTTKTYGWPFPSCSLRPRSWVCLHGFDLARPPALVEAAHAGRSGVTRSYHSCRRSPREEGAGQSDMTDGE